MTDWRQTQQRPKTKGLQELTAARAVAQHRCNYVREMKRTDCKHQGEKDGKQPEATWGSEWKLFAGGAASHHTTITFTWLLRPHCAKGGLQEWLSPRRTLTVIQLNYERCCYDHKSKSCLFTVKSSFFWSVLWGPWIVRIFFQLCLCPWRKKNKQNKTQKATNPGRE